MTAMRSTLAALALVMVATMAVRSGAAAVGKEAPDFTADSVMPGDNVRACFCRRNVSVVVNSVSS